MCIDGYKALDPIDVRVPGKLLFLIGSNGAGKSSCLQALAFVHFFASGNPSQFFVERAWRPMDVRSRTNPRHNTIRYHLLFQSADGQEVLWQFAWGLSSQASIAEKMWLRRAPKDEPVRLFDYDRRRGLIRDGEPLRGLMSPGSILNIMDPAAITSEHAIAKEIIDWATRITSLELLSPIAMRSNNRGTPKGIGVRGQRLAGFLATLDAKTKDRIVRRLADFYPLESVNTVRKRAGWIDLRIGEIFGIGAISATHVSDGFLRLLALCAIPEFGHRSSLVLLDEIEDGIEPHILPRLIERIIQDSNSQFIMTSHSPLLINFFESSDVILISRSPDGRSQLTPLSELDVVKQGVEYFGGGEIWANTGISTLNEQALAASKPLESPEEGRFTQTWANEFMGLS